MTEQEIIDMAERAGLVMIGRYDDPSSAPQELLNFAKLVYQKARADDMESNQRIVSSEDAAEKLFNAAHKAAEAINSALAVVKGRSSGND